MSAWRARVRAPGYPGTYVLVWDVVQEHRTWLSLEGVFPGRSIASVEGTPVGAPLPSRGRMPAGVMRMPRSVLWSTALTIARERPLLGIGPDNFRHAYGRYLGLAAWDERVHANNSYLEVLTGTGGCGFEHFTATAGHGDGEARADQRAGDGFADPGAGAGNKCDSGRHGRVPPSSSSIWAAMISLNVLSARKPSDKAREGA